MVSLRLKFRTPPHTTISPGCAPETLITVCEYEHVKKNYEGERIYNEQVKHLQGSQKDIPE